MSLFFRRADTEERKITALPWNYGGTGRTEVTQQRALSLTPVFSAARHIADFVSSLPLHTYRELDSGARNRITLAQLFAQLAERGQLQPWIFTALTSLVLRGNAVGIITATDGYGNPTRIEWLSMDQVSVDESEPRPVWYVDGRRVSPLDLVHIPWFTVPGRTLGLSPIEAYASTVNGGLRAQEFGTEWFESGGVPPGTFRNSEKRVSQEEADTIKARLVSAIRSRKPIVYGNDWEFNPISIPPEQAQFIETQRLTANQIAAIYGLDPIEIGGETANNSLTYTNEEMRQIKRLANLRPWIVRLEHAFTSWLPERQYVKFNGDAVIRADLKTRWEVHRIKREIGAASIDEIRALEDETPLPNGAGADYSPLRVRQPTERPSAEGANADE